MTATARRPSISGRKAVARFGGGPDVGGGHELRRSPLRRGWNGGIPGRAVGHECSPIMLRTPRGPGWAPSDARRAHDARSRASRAGFQRPSVRPPGGSDTGSKMGSYPSPPVPRGPVAIRPRHVPPRERDELAPAGSTRPGSAKASTQHVTGAPPIPREALERREELGVVLGVRRVLARVASRPDARPPPRASTSRPESSARDGRPVRHPEAGLDRGIRLERRRRPRPDRPRSHVSRARRAPRGAGGAARGAREACVAIGWRRRVSAAQSPPDGREDLGLRREQLGQTGVGEVEHPAAVAARRTACPWRCPAARRTCPRRCRRR